MPLVQITTEALFHTSGDHLRILKSAGLAVGYPAQHPIVTEEDTLSAVRGAVAVLAGSEPYTARVLDESPELRVISRNGVGYDCVDVAAATERGVAVTITPQGNHEAVAEHTLALVLALARSVVRCDRDVRVGAWRRNEPYVPLRGKTLGLVGLGRIGRSVARRAAAFRMRLLCFEPYPDQTLVDQLGIELVALDDLLKQSDFVTLHSPLTPQTRGLIDRRSLALMRRGSFLVNTARGGLIVEDDLCEALRSRHLAGAALDVFTHEPPPPDHPLFELDNVVFSPHAAALDTQAVIDMANAAAQNISDVLAGRWPDEGLLNPAVRERIAK